MATRGERQEGEVRPIDVTTKKARGEVKAFESRGERSVADMEALEKMADFMTASFVERLKKKLSDVSSDVSDDKITLILESLKFDNLRIEKIQKYDPSVGRQLPGEVTKLSYESDLPSLDAGTKDIVIAEMARMAALKDLSRFGSLDTTILYASLAKGEKVDENNRIDGGFHYYDDRVWRGDVGRANELLNGLDEVDPEFFADNMVALFAQEQMGGNKEGAAKFFSDFGKRNTSFQVDSMTGLPYRANKKETDLEAMRKVLEKYEHPGELPKTYQELNEQVADLTGDVEAGKQETATARGELEGSRQEVAGLKGELLKAQGDNERLKGEAETARLEIERLGLLIKQIQDSAQRGTENSGTFGGGAKKALEDILAKARENA